MRAGLLPDSPPDMEEYRESETGEELLKLFDYNRRLHERLEYLLSQTQKDISEIEQRLEKIEKAGGV